MLGSSHRCGRECSHAARHSRTAVSVCLFFSALFASLFLYAVESRLKRGKREDAFGKFTFGKVPSGEVRGKRGDGGGGDLLGWRQRGHLRHTPPGGPKAGRKAAIDCQSVQTPKGAVCSLFVSLAHALGASASSCPFWMSSVQARQ